MLQLVAERLRPILEEVVFVGGQVAELLITQPASESIRPTYDVDLVIPVTTHQAYADFEEHLRALGLANDTREGAPICRWASTHRLMKMRPSAIARQLISWTNAIAPNRYLTGYCNSVMCPNGARLRVGSKHANLRRP